MCLKRQLSWVLAPEARAYITAWQGLRAGGNTAAYNHLGFLCLLSSFHMVGRQRGGGKGLGHTAIFLFPSAEKVAPDGPPVSGISNGPTGTFWAGSAVMLSPVSCRGLGGHGRQGPAVVCHQSVRVSNVAL